jgi:hypothetical protein
MAEPVANDWKAIRDRMQQIKIGKTSISATLLRMPRSRLDPRLWALRVLYGLRLRHLP